MIDTDVVEPEYAEGLGTFVDLGVDVVDDEGGEVASGIVLTE
jgi:hypothetical protein